MDIEKLTTKQVIAASWLAKGKTINEAAAYAGVTEKTLDNWLARVPQFKAAIEQAKAATWQNTINILIDSAKRSVQVLLEVMNDSAESGATRMHAARIVLENAKSAVELNELQQRLEAIEQALQGGANQ